VGDGEAWKQVICNVIEDKTQLCNLLQGKTLYCALYGIYTVALSDLTDIFQQGSQKTIPDESIATTAVAGPTRTEPSGDEFREQRRRKRNISSEGEASSSKKAPQLETQKSTTTRNYFAPLRTAEMDIEDNSAAEGGTPSEQQAASLNKGRPPPIILTSPTNLISLQRNL
jgi:hypothetical protein